MDTAMLVIMERLLLMTETFNGGVNNNNNNSNVSSHSNRIDAICNDTTTTGANTTNAL